MKLGAEMSQLAWASGKVDKNQIDLLKSSGFTYLIIDVNRQYWNSNATDNPLGVAYKDYVKQLVAWCKPEIETVIELTRDTSYHESNFDTLDSASAGKGAVILNVNGRGDEWRNWGSEIISYCDPDGIAALNEPRGGGGQVTMDNYLQSFLYPSISTYKAVKSNIKIVVQPFPFYSYEKLSTINDSNVYYDWHLYYPQSDQLSSGHPYFVEAVNGYYEGRLAEAKDWLYKYLDEFKFVNIPKNRLVWGELGCFDNINGVQQWLKEPNQPNWRQWMQDCIDYGKTRNNYAIAQYSLGITRYPILDRDTGYTTFTPYAEVLLENMTEPQAPLTQKFDVIQVLLILLFLLFALLVGGDEV